MLNVLLESRASRTSRVGGTMASTLVHAAIIAGAVAVTIPKAGRANDGPKTVPDIHYIAIRPQPPRPTQSAPPAASTTPVAPPAPGPVLKFNGPEVPVIREVVPSTTISTPEEFGTGVPTGGPIGAPPGLGSPIDGVVEVRLVDRAPRLIGTPTPPVFPSALRYTGRGGRVLVEFVVDTAGRAEMGGFTVVQSADPLFAESVRAALPRYRFSPGEAGGRKVRTLVQLPFDFTLR